MARRSRCAELGRHVAMRLGHDGMSWGDTGGLDQETAEIDTHALERIARRQQKKQSPGRRIAMSSTGMSQYSSSCQPELLRRKR